MPFHIHVKTGPYPLMELAERVLDRDEVMFGRGDMNDVTLPDDRRLVSTQHFTIRCRGGEYFITDVGSKNGSYLNRERLAREETRRLTEHDEIRVGEYVLVFGPVLSAVRSHEDDDETLCVPSLPLRCERVVEDLRAIYATGGHEDSKERRDMVVETLRAACDGLDRAEQYQLVAYVEASFPDPRTQQAAALSGERHAGAEQASSCAGARHDESARGVGNADAASSLGVPSSRSLRADRQAQIVSIFLQFIVDALKARRTFQQEMDVEVTRLLGKDANPVKWAQTSEELYAYLFDSEASRQQGDDSVQHLNEALRDLALQPIGLTAGFRECVRGLLRQLDPQTLESEIKNTMFGIGRCAPRFVVRHSAWTRYVRKHQELLDNEARTIKNLLDDEFGKGYLNVYSKSRSA